MTLRDLWTRSKGVHKYHGDSCSLQSSVMRAMSPPRNCARKRRWSGIERLSMEVRLGLKKFNDVWFTPHWASGVGRVQLRKNVALHIALLSQDSD